MKTLSLDTIGFEYACCGLDVTLLVDIKFQNDGLFVHKSDLRSYTPQKVRHVQ